MKKMGLLTGFLPVLALALFWAGNCLAVDYTVQTVPNTHLQNAASYVSNPDAIIDPTDEAAINALLQDLEKQTGIQIAVVALHSIGNNDARMFATDLFNYWGIGDQRDRGLLIQLITEPSQRSITFETGYGLEGVLTDAVALRMRQIMLPDLQEGAYGTGLRKGVEATAQYLLANDEERAAIMEEESEVMPTWLVLLIILVPIAIIAAAPFLGRRRPKICPNCGNKSLYYEGRETLKAATATATGLSREIWRCRVCGFTDHTDQILPKISSAMAAGGLGGLGGGGFGGGGFGGRGGGFGGGGGGGSWGGGRSGGGGGSSRF